MKRAYVTKFNTVNEIEQKLLEALSWIRWENIVAQDAKVFIKPNLTWPVYTPGVTTSPVVLEAVVSILRSRTPNITIGESDGGYHSFEAEEAFRKHGIYEIADRYGAKVVNLCKTEAETVQGKIGSKTLQIKLSSLLLHDIDVLISIPVPKVHAMTGVSLGFKNYWGCIPSAMRLKHHPLFSELVLLINRMFNSQIVIYDGTYFLDKNGPMTGEPVQMNLLIAANEVGVGDFVCCQLMGVNPFKISHLKTAHKAGMFPSSLDEIELNTDLGGFVGRSFCLERNLLNWIALLAFNSNLLTTLLYDSVIGKLLHKILYTIRQSRFIRHLLYGRFEPPNVKRGS